MTRLPKRIFYTTITEEDGRALGFGETELGEFDYLEDLEILDMTLSDLGIEPVRLNWGGDLVNELLTINPPLLWNLNSGLIGPCREAQVPALCEMLGIPLVGSGSWTAFITQDKTLTANWIREKHIPVCIPESIMVANAKELDIISTLTFPGTYIVKPNNEDSSRGIDESSIGNSLKNVEDEAKHVLEEWGPARIERYIEGFDISANLACDDSGVLFPLLPVMIESDIGIYTGGMKNAISNAPIKKRSSLSAFNKKLAKDVMELALMIGKSLKFRHYARIDMRYDPNLNQVYFLECNICPTFEPEDDYAYGASLSGINFSNLISSILTAAHHDAHTSQHKMDTPRRIRASVFQTKNLKTRSN